MKRKITYLTTAIIVLFLMLITWPGTMLGQSPTSVAAMSVVPTSGDPTTSGGSFTTTFSHPSNKAYLQDGSTVGTEYYMQILNEDPFWTATPTSITLTANLGGGTTKDPLANSVYVVLLDSDGDPIDGTSKVLTTKITNTGGSDFDVSFTPITGVYGVKISHVKEKTGNSNYNVRYFSFDLSYVAGSNDPSISVSPTAPSTVTCSGGSVEFSITPTNIASPDYSLQFYEAATGNTTASQPAWITNVNFVSNTLTLTIAANNGAQRYAYFTVKSGTTESASRVTLTQAAYTVTPPTLTAGANFDANIDVTITPASGNATVYYTTDNSIPSNTNGTAITSATVINLKATTIVKAIGYDANSNASTVTSATYTRQTVNINTITSTGSYSVVGTVVATHSKGFVMGDGTGYVYYYYKDYSGGVALNNKIKFSSKSISAYAHVLEYNNQAYSNNQSASNYEPLQVTTLNGSGIAAYMTGNHLSDYVQIEGTVDVSTTNDTYDINVSGATYNVRLAYPTDAQKSALSALHGKKVRVKGYFTGFNSNTDANATHFTIMLESVEDINPVVAASGDLNEFTYAYGSGPSDAQSINVSGSLLTANVTVTASGNYEVSLSENSGYASSVTLTQSAGSVSSTPVYIRLKSGLNSGTYSTNSDKITVSSTGATDVTVALSGSVTHAIAYGTPNHCTTLSGNTAAAYGTTVTITAEPASGYKLDSWNITQTTGGASAGITPVIVSGNDYTITMPDFNITVNATFVPAYTITVTNSTPAGGSVYTTPTSAAEGDEITITVTPNSGYDLNSMVVKDSELNEIEVTNNKFEMPASNVTITVSFIATYTITYDKNGESVTGTAPVDALSPYHSGATVTVLDKGDLAWEGHTFEWWSDHEDWETVGAEIYAPGETFDISENTTLYAQWSINSYGYTKVVTGQDAGASAVLKVGGSTLATNDVIEYGTEVTVAVTLSNASNYAYAIKVKNNTTGDYLTVTSDDKFTMPASAVTVTVVTDLVATLTNSDMANVTNAGTTYGTGNSNFKTVTAEDGFYWEANAFQSTNQTDFLQINTTSNSSYIKLPVFPGKIEKINFSVTNGSGNNTTTVLYINTEIGAGDGNMPHSESSSSKSRTIDMTNVFYNTGYIVSSAAIRITNISVKYRPYQDMAGSEITIIEPDVTVSIPEDASVSATNLTIPASSGLTIKSGATLTVNGTFTNSGNANNLVIEDGGQLITSSSVQLTYKKNITSAAKDGGWYTISTPVHTASNTFLTPGSVENLILDPATNYDFFYYDEASHTWMNYKKSAFNLNIGQGYLYRNNGAELHFAGYNNQAAYYEKALSYASSEDKLLGFNLIGNPYPQNITMSDVTVNNGGTLTGGYVLSESGAWSADVAATITPTQGFLVQIDKTGVTARITKPAGGAKSRSDRDYLKFIVANSQYEDAAFALFEEGYGLNKIDHRNSDVPMLYIPKDRDIFAIVTMDNSTQSFNLNLKAKTTGKYTLSYEATGEYSYLHIIDRMTGEDVDMLLEGEYSFIASPSDNENRFIVNMHHSNNAENSENSIFAYQSGNDIVVNGEGELQIFDVMGRMVGSQRINGVETINIPLRGVYIFRLNEKTQKIVVE